MPASARVLRYTALAGLSTLGGYAAHAGYTWLRYGTTQPAGHGEKDELLDGFIPVYEVAERHRILIHAPAAAAFAIAREADLESSALIRAIFRARELVLGAKSRTHEPRGLVAMLESIGWRILAEVPDREIVGGCVTKPWEADVIFHPIPPDEFAEFCEPGWVKIAWTLRAEPINDCTSRLNTETRAIATDPESRRRFRRYWSLVSPGIVLIRRAALRAAKRQAEAR